MIEVSPDLPGYAGFCRVSYTSRRHLRSIQSHQASVTHRDISMRVVAVDNHLLLVPRRQRRSSSEQSSLTTQRLLTQHPLYSSARRALFTGNMWSVWSRILHPSQSPFVNVYGQSFTSPTVKRTQQARNYQAPASVQSFCLSGGHEVSSESHLPVRHLLLPQLRIPS